MNKKLIYQVSNAVAFVIPSLGLIGAGACFAYSLYLNPNQSFNDLVKSNISRTMVFYASFIMLSGIAFSAWLLEGKEDTRLFANILALSLGMSVFSISMLVKDIVVKSNMASFSEIIKDNIGNIIASVAAVGVFVFSIYKLCEVSNHPRVLE